MRGLVVSEIRKIQRKIRLFELNSSRPQFPASFDSRINIHVPLPVSEPARAEVEIIMEQRMSTPEKLKSALDAFKHRQEQKQQQIKFELEQLTTVAKDFFQTTTRYVYHVIEPVHEQIEITAKIAGEPLAFRTQKITFPVAGHRIEFIPAFTKHGEFGFRTNGLQQELWILPNFNRWQAFSSGGAVIESEFTSEYFVSLLMSVIPNN